MFHDEVTIKEQKIIALEDIKEKLQDHSLNANNYYAYIFLKYQVKRNAVFSGLFNRTEKLIDKAGKSLVEQKLQQSNLEKKNFYRL